MEAPRGVHFLPCLHMVVCKACFDTAQAAGRKECPLCSCPVETALLF